MKRTAISWDTRKGLRQCGQDSLCPMSQVLKQSLQHILEQCGHRCGLRTRSMQMKHTRMSLMLLSDSFSFVGPPSYHSRPATPEFISNLKFILPKFKKELLSKYFSKFQILL